jgi:hypothetical protein
MEEVKKKKRNERTNETGSFSMENGTCSYQTVENRLVFRDLEKNRNVDATNTQQTNKQLLLLLLNPQQGTIKFLFSSIFLNFFFFFFFFLIFNKFFTINYPNNNTIIIHNTALMIYLY